MSCNRRRQCRTPRPSVVVHPLQSGFQRQCAPFRVPERSMAPPLVHQLAQPSAQRAVGHTRDPSFYLSRVSSVDQCADSGAKQLSAYRPISHVSGHISATYRPNNGRYVTCELYIGHWVRHAQVHARCSRGGSLDRSPCSVVRPSASADPYVKSVCREIKRMHRASTARGAIR